MRLGIVRGRVVLNLSVPSLEPVAVANVATRKGCRFLIGQRLEGDDQTSGEPLVIPDWLGAGRGSEVILSTDHDLALRRLSNTTPGRLAVVGIVDSGGGS